MRQARERFRLQSRQRPWAWCLFAVQAAVQLGVREVAITTRSTSVGLRMDLPFGSQALLSEILWESYDENGPAGLCELQASVGHALGLDPRALSVQIETDGSTLRATWAEGDVSFTPGTGDGQAFTMTLEKIKRPDLDALREALAFCPIPVRIDGELVSGAFFEKTRASYRRYTLVPSGSRPSLATSAYGLCARSYRIDSDGSVSQVDRPEGTYPLPTSTVVEVSGNLERADWVRASEPSEESDVVWLGSWGDAATSQREHLGVITGFCATPLGFSREQNVLACRAMFCRTDDNRLPQVVVIRRGVSLDPISVDGPRGWRVAIACDALPVDLSGFVASESEIWLRLSSWIRQQLEWMEQSCPS